MLHSVSSENGTNINTTHASCELTLENSAAKKKKPVIFRGAHIPLSAHSCGLKTVI